jgi:GT2 family glycosyltransferase
MDIELSIVIPSYQRTDLLAACLASVLRHAPARAEVLVIDDGSPDGCVSAVATRFAGVRCLRLPRRRGFCTAANEGIRSVQGPVVELLNDDTEVTSGWAHSALPLFEDTSVGTVAPLVLNQTEGEQDPRIDSAGDRYFRGGIASKRYHGRRLSTVALRRCRVFGASASSAFYRREAVLKVGGYPEHFGAYFEDVDLAFRLRRAGFEAVFEPRSRVWHHGSSSYGRTSPQLLEQQSCNEERVFWRNLPAHVLIPSLPLHFAVLAAKGWRRWREGQLRPFLCGRLRAWSEVPSLLRQHRCSIEERN